MNLGDPLGDLLPGVRGELLRALVPLVQPVSRRRLAELAGASPGHASSVLEDLISTGLVDEVRAGGSSLVSLNRSHLAVKYLVKISELRKELLDRLRREVGGIDNVLGAWLFGSVARGDADSTSDIDILIVSNDLDSDEFHSRISRLHTKATNWTGNEIEVVEHSLKSFNGLVESANPLAKEIAKDGIALCEILPEIQLRRLR